VFIDAPGMLQSVSVAPAGDRLELGAPRALFPLDAVPSDGWTYAFSRDGQRLLVARPAGSTWQRRLQVVMHWAQSLNGAAAAGAESVNTP